MTREDAFIHRVEFGQGRDVAVQAVAVERASTRNCCRLCGTVIRLAGVTTSLVTTGSDAAGPGAPQAIQAASVLYSVEPIFIRRPPPCGTCSVGFLRSRLCSGSRKLTRRSDRSRTMYAWSADGSKPKTESLNPAWPYWAAWQAPMLQPGLLKIGAMSRV